MENIPSLSVNPLQTTVPPIPVHIQAAPRQQPQPPPASKLNPLRSTDEAARSDSAHSSSTPAKQRGHTRNPTLAQLILLRSASSPASLQPASRPPPISSQLRRFHTASSRARPSRAAPGPSGLPRLSRPPRRPTRTPCGPRNAHAPSDPSSSRRQPAVAGVFPAHGLSLAIEVLPRLNTSATDRGLTALGSA